MKNNFVTYNKVVRKLSELKSSTAHSLIELSERQWKRLQSRSILLTEMVSQKTNNNKVEYKKYVLGSDVTLKRSFGQSSGLNMQWRTPMLTNIHGGFMLLVGSKEEIVHHNPEVIIVDGSSQELLSDNINDNSNYQPSGIVILCMVKLERNLEETKYLWGHKDAVNIKKMEE